MNYDRLILGIDPGTNFMGYAILGVSGKSLQAVATGTIALNKFESHYTRLRRIFDRVSMLVDQYAPSEMAIEAPFFGKNVQSMLKLGRAQGVAIAAALTRDVSVVEYEPRKIKMAITGNGAASKEQVAMMLQRILKMPEEWVPEHLDASDALAAALCHYYESSRPQMPKTSGSWKDFIANNPDRVK